MSAESSLHFCPRCSNLLTFRQISQQIRFSCNSCPYIFNLSEKISLNRSYYKLKVRRYDFPTRSWILLTAFGIISFNSSVFYRESTHYLAVKKLGKTLILPTKDVRLVAIHELILCNYKPDRPMNLWPHFTNVVITNAGIAGVYNSARYSFGLFDSQCLEVVLIT